MYRALIASVLHVARLDGACVVNHLQPKRPHVRPARLRWPASGLMSVLREVCNPATRVSARCAKVLCCVQARVGLVSHVATQAAVDNDLVDCSAIWRRVRSSLRKANSRKYYSGAQQAPLPSAYFLIASRIMLLLLARGLDSRADSIKAVRRSRSSLYSDTQTMRLILDSSTRSVYAMPLEVSTGNLASRRPSR